MDRGGLGNQTKVSRMNIANIDYKTVVEDLKKLGDPRAVAAWKRLGFNTDIYLGVNLTKLGAYAKKLKKNHDLAQSLWESGIHDARLLATMIEDPKLVTEGQIRRWVSDAYYWDLVDKICSNVVAKTSFGASLMKDWLKSSEEFVRRAGYMTLAGLAKSNGSVSDHELAQYLVRIEKEIAGEKNWVREAMNYAVIAIGSRNARLNDLALGVAERIGKVEIDYGETSCKAPDANSYLTKAQSKIKAGI